MLATLPLLVVGCRATSAPLEVELVSTPEEAPVTVLPLPPVGSVAAERLADGTPVFVVHGEDGAPVVVDARDPHDVGVQILVGWCASAGWFEEVPFGSRFLPDGSQIAGPAPTDLATYDVEVRDGAVHVGSRRPATGRSGDPDAHLVAGPTCELQAPVPGQVPTAEGLLTHDADRPPVPLAEAVRRPPGDQVLVEGHLERIGVDPPVLCEPGDAPPYCADGGVRVESSWMGKPDPDAVSGLAGRFLVRVAGDGFRDVTAMGGSAWYGQPFRGEWELTGELAVRDSPDVPGFGMYGPDVQEPWLLVQDDPYGADAWTGFAFAEDVVVIGRRALAGHADGRAVPPAALEQAVGDGRLAGVRFLVVLRKVDGLATRVEELPEQR